MFPEYIGDVRLNILEIASLTYWRILLNILYMLFCKFTGKGFINVLENISKAYSKESLNIVKIVS